MNPPRRDLAVVTFALVFPSLVTLAYFVLAAEATSAVQQTVYSVGKTLQFLLPAVWVLAVQRRRLRWKRPTQWGMTAGLVFGGAVLAATLALYYSFLQSSELLAGAVVAMREKLLGVGVDSPAKYVALGIFYSLVHSLLEEYYWRWFVFGELRRFVPLAAAVVLSSLGFMAHHVLVLAWYFGWFSPATLVFSLSVAIGGAVWAVIYHRSQALWGVWASHLLVDVAIFLIGYDLVRAAWAG